MTNYFLHIIFSTCDLTKLVHFITLNYQFLTVFPSELSFSTSHKDVAPTATWSAIPTTNNGGSELGRQGYMRFYTFVIAMNKYDKNFPRISHQKQKSLQNFNPGTSNSPPIPHYWWRKIHSYYNNTNTGPTKCAGQIYNKLFSIVSSHNMLLIHS